MCALRIARSNHAREIAPSRGAEVNGCISAVGTNIGDFSRLSLRATIKLLRELRSLWPIPMLRHYRGFAWRSVLICTVVSLLVIAGAGCRKSPNQDSDLSETATDLPEKNQSTRLISSENQAKVQ